MYARNVDRWHFLCSLVATCKVALQHSLPTCPSGQLLVSRSWTIQGSTLFGLVAGLSQNEQLRRSYDQDPSVDDTRIMLQTAPGQCWSLDLDDEVKQRERRRRLRWGAAMVVTGSERRSTFAPVASTQEARSLSVWPAWCMPDPDANRDATNAKSEERLKFWQVLSVPSELSSCWKVQSSKMIQETI